MFMGSAVLWTYDFIKPTDVSSTFPVCEHDYLESRMPEVCGTCERIQAPHMCLVKLIASW